MVPAADSGMVKADAGSTPSAFCTVREGLNPVNAPESRGGGGADASGPIQGDGARPWHGAGATGWSSRGNAPAFPGQRQDAVAM